MPTSTSRPERGPARVRALRGATTIDVDSADHVVERVTELLNEMFERNEVDADDLVSILFSATHDVRSAFPAVAARTRLGLADVPLMNMLEIDVDGALPRCVRVMAHLYSERSRAEMRHVFLHGAVVLRPDLGESAIPLAGESRGEGGAPPAGGDGIGR